LFGFLKKKTDIEVLVTEAHRAQQITELYFRRTLKCEKSAIREMELTYFSLALITINYFKFGHGKNKEAILDELTQIVLERNTKSSIQAIQLGTAVSEYRNRYSQYASLMGLVFNPKESDTGNPETTFMMHVFECVTGATARGFMVKISTSATAFVRELISEQITCFKKLT
jgi:hypothetical protein